MKKEEEPEKLTITEKRDGPTHKVSITIPDSHIEKAYKEGYYIEAIQLIHYKISNKMHFIFIAKNTTNDPSNRGALERSKINKKEWGTFLHQPYNFLVLADILLDMGVIDPKLYQRLNKFNAKRNIIIHRIMTQIPTEDKRDSYYKEGMEILEEVDKIQKIHSKIMFETLKRFADSLPKGTKRQKTN